MRSLGNGANRCVSSPSGLHALGSCCSPAAWGQESFSLQSCGLREDDCRMDLYLQPAHLPTFLHTHLHPGKPAVLPGHPEMCSLSLLSNGGDGNHCLRSASFACIPFTLKMPPEVGPSVSDIWQGIKHISSAQ